VRKGGSSVRCAAASRAAARNGRVPTMEEAFMAATGYSVETEPLDTTVYSAGIALTLH